MRPVKIYTTSYCPYCHRAKQLLRDRKIPFEEIDCEGDDETREWLIEATGQRTVPQIFFGEEPIGGYTDLAALDRSGGLLQKLES